MAFLLKSDGTVTPLPGPLTLEQLQQHVGGYIEIVALGIDKETGGKVVLVFNEEGLLEGLRSNTNTMASMFWRKHNPHSTALVGDVVMAVVLDGGEATERFV